MHRRSLTGGQATWTPRAVMRRFALSTLGGGSRAPDRDPDCARAGPAARTERRRQPNLISDPSQQAAAGRRAQPAPSAVTSTVKRRPSHITCEVSFPSRSFDRRQAEESLLGRAVQRPDHRGRYWLLHDPARAVCSTKTCTSASASTWMSDMKAITFRLDRASTAATRSSRIAA